MKRLIASRLSTANFEALRLGGPDAEAGLDDWVLSNGTVCVAISDPSHESPVAPRGGTLIDLGHCGRADDQWAVLQPMLNLSPSEVVDYGAVETGVTTAEAWLRIRAMRSGVEIVTTYSLSLSEPTALRIVTRAERTAPGDRLFALGSTLLHPGAQTRPFSIQRDAPDRSFGFHFPHSDRHSLVSMFNSLHAADLQILVGAEGFPPISYGIEQRGGTLSLSDGTSEELRPFSATGEHFTTFNTLLFPFWVGDTTEAPSLIDLARVTYADLPLRSATESEIRIWVGDQADVASITNQIWRKQRVVIGAVSDPNAKIHLERVSGAPVTVVRPDAAGRFEVRLPSGDYRARAVAPGDREAVLRFSVEAQKSAVKRAGPLPPVELPQIKLAMPSAIRITPSPFRGRIYLYHAETGEPVVFGADLFDLHFGTVDSAAALEAPYLTYVGFSETRSKTIESVGSAPVGQSRRSDQSVRRIVPPGRYALLAVRGPEYEIFRKSIEVGTQQEISLELPALARTAPTPGYLAADLHVHSGESFDSGLPQTAQIEAFVASGAEVLVATEHDRIIDPSSALDETGLAGALAIVNGLEMTSSFEGGDSPHSTGHWNLFPMTPTPRAFRGGVPNLEGRRIRDAIADIREIETKPFLQLNHPRAGASVGEGDIFFNHLGVAGVPFDPTHPLLDAPNSSLLERSASTGLRDLDYDGVELLNGSDMLRYRRVRADWFSLLLQGEFKVATANSDSHRLGVLVAVPRTYIRVRSDRLEDFDERELITSLRRGAAYGSTGPLLGIELTDPDEPDSPSSLGETFHGSKAILQVKVEAAEWVPVGEWRAYVNGELVHRAPIRSGETKRLPLVFEKDSFVTVEVEGKPTELYEQAMPGFTPFAFTNPIFIDRDGNGRFDAPGLPVPLPPTLAQPDLPDMP